MVKTGSSWAGTFVTLDSTGALAAGTPSGVLYVDGVANGATVTITGANPYKWAVTLPSLTAGQRVDMYITATIAGVSTAGVVASEQADTALTSDVKAETALILADTGTDGVVLKAAGLADDAVTEIQSGLAMAADLQDVEDKIDVIATDTTTEIPATLATLALESTLTAIKGAGWTDETLVSIQAGVDSIDVSGVADAVWDEAIAEHVDAGSTGAALTASGSAGDPWSTALPGAYGAGSAGLALSDILAKTDQLDVSSTSFVTAVSGSTITILRGDTFSGDLLNLGSLASYVSLDFTVKRGSGEADDDAIIRIRKNATGLTDGLVRLNGAAYTTGTDGSITITDAPTGDVTIMLKAAVTDDLVPGSYVYDIQLIEAAGVTTLTSGTLVVSADVTRLVA